ncbi:hypothetical protein Cni_G06842 [Canna indica]|uniref:Mur ligase central domain-containing protein n=1 Tax=Canna indica TaxID=4628 RepID=A0AAQ3K039_9LILI|nr:hypothetical protein Cni_G06842 [Canna indica]
MAAPSISLGLLSDFAVSPKPSSALHLRVRCSFENLKGQRVAVVGLGASGRAAAKLALSRGASVVAIDKNEQLVPLEGDPQFSEYTDLKTILGYCDSKQLANTDRVVVSPGVPLWEYGLSSFLHSGKLVMSELDFAAEMLPQDMKIIAVIGTNGKSTVTSFSGQVAIILNLTSDHLERHKTMKNYAEIKCRLFSHMKHTKLAVLPVDNCNVARVGGYPGIKMDFKTKVTTFSFPTTGFVAHLQLGDLKALGAHNESNAAVAAFSVLGLDVGIDCEFIESTVGILSILPHRMQVVCTDADGITWVDDSKATNIESTLTGLKGFKEQKAVVLLGGLAKALNEQDTSGFEQLIDVLKHHKGVVTFGSSGAMIQKTLCDGGLRIPCVRAMNLEEAVHIAKSMATYG